MKPAVAWALVTIAAVATWHALTAPLWPVLAWMAVGAVVLRRGHVALGFFFVAGAAINGLLLGWLSGTGGWTLDAGGVRDGVLGAARITAVLAVNLAILSRVSAAAWLDGLRLGRRATAFLAAVMIAAHDIARDARRMVDVRRLDGSWQAGRVRAAAAMLPTLLMAALRRGQRRAEALAALGLPVHPRFAAVVALTALAVAGRLALVPVPNVALTYVIVFAGGLAFGARTAALAGAWSMALSNLLLSGLAPASFVNVPAMAFVGAVGGWTRRIDFAGTAGKAMAAVLGAWCTLAFSIISDAATWLLIGEFRAQPELLWIRLAAGLAFNAVPAAVNGVLFAATAQGVCSAFPSHPQQQPECHPPRVAG